MQRKWHGANQPQLCSCVTAYSVPILACPCPIRLHAPQVKLPSPYVTSAYNFTPPARSPEFNLTGASYVLRNPGPPACFPNAPCDRQPQPHSADCQAFLRGADGSGADGSGTAGGGTAGGGTGTAGGLVSAGATDNETSPLRWVLGADADTLAAAVGSSNTDSAEAGTAAGGQHQHVRQEQVKGGGTGAEGGASKADAGGFAATLIRVNPDDTTGSALRFGMGALPLLLLVCLLGLVALVAVWGGVRLRGGGAAGMRRVGSVGSRTRSGDV